MPPSLVVQSTQDAIEALHQTAALWGRLFEQGPAQRTQLEGQADQVAAVFLAFNVAYGALPRFRTEPALRRFMEASQELERSIRGLRGAALSSAIGELASASAEGARLAAAAFAAGGGKPVEPQETAKPVQGSVFKLLSDRGYGFVRATGAANEVFFTAQNVRGARFGELREGQNVSFRAVPDPRVPGRMHAIEVQPLR